MNNNHETIDDIIEELLSGEYTPLAYRIMAALERNKRNCDHYKTPEEAYDAWREFCKAHYQSKDDKVYECCDGCPFNKSKGGCFVNFLYAMYKPEGEK